MTPHYSMLHPTNESQVNVRDFLRPITLTQTCSREITRTHLGSHTHTQTHSMCTYTCAFIHTHTHSHYLASSGHLLPNLDLFSEGDQSPQVQESKVDQGIRVLASLYPRREPTF